jgi:hypothetical protein
MCVQVTNELGDDFKAKVRTQEFTSKLHLVDLAGSERVKRSGVTGEGRQGVNHGMFVAVAVARRLHVFVYFVNHSYR